MSDQDSDQPRKLAIAECVAAMDMLRQQVCGMYALLEEQHQAQQAAADRLDRSHLALQALVDRLPNDMLTLTAIQRAAGSVEQAIATMPSAVTTAAQALKVHTAKQFDTTMAPHVQTIENASRHVTLVANDMNTALRRFDLLSISLVALAGGLAGLVCGFGLFWWSFADDIASVKQSTAVIQGQIAEQAPARRLPSSRANPGR